MSSKLARVSTPAGFGTTTLVSAWLATRNAHKEELLRTYVHTLLLAFVQEQPAAAMHPRSGQAASPSVASAFLCSNA